MRRAHPHRTCHICCLAGWLTRNYLTQEFSAAIAAITAALQGPNAATAAATVAAASHTHTHTSASGSNNSSGSGSNSSSLSGAGVRPSASGRKPVLPQGVSTLNPDSFFHAKQSLVLALNQLHAAFKSSTPALAKALLHAKSEIEDIGLFE